MSSVKLTTTGGSGGTIELNAPANTTGNAAVQLTLPVDDGTSSQYLQTNGSGVLSWAGVGGATGTDYNDNVNVRFGTDNDMQIKHSGTDASIANNTGNLYIQTADSSITMQLNNGEKLVKAIADGAVELYHDNTKKIETSSYGVHLGDNGRLTLGNTAGSPDCHFYHDTSNTNIQNITGDIVIKSNSDGDKAIVVKNGGGAELYHDNGKKFETQAGGTWTTGNMKASSDGNWVNQTGAFHELNGSGSSGYELHIRNHNASPGAQYIQAIKFQAAAPDNTSAQFLYCADSSANRFTIYSNGDYYSSDGGVVNSDRTLKENIVDATSKLEDLKKLKVRNYNFKAEVHPNETHKRLGFIAQEVEEVFPGLVDEYRFNPKEEETPVMKKAIKDAWAPILVKALQEAVAKIETLETKVAALEAG